METMPEGAALYAGAGCGVLIVRPTKVTSSAASLLGTKVDLKDKLRHMFRLDVVN